MPTFSPKAYALFRKSILPLNKKVGTNFRSSAKRPNKIAPNNRTILRQITERNRAKQPNTIPFSWKINNLELSLQGDKKALGHDNKI